MILTALFALYFIGVLLLLGSWLSQKKNTWKQVDVSLFYSIIIPVRDEGENLKTLFESLEQLNFPQENYEVIVVDDHSSTKDLEVYKELISRSNFPAHLIQLVSNSGKKYALALGVEESRGEVIVSTDGDCKVKPNWLQTIAFYFEQNLPTHMVFGGVTFYNEFSVFHKLQTLEFSSLIGTGAASLNLGLPNMCNGANLAFDKKVFHEVGGYADNANIPSGDDEFLMHKFYKHNPKAVRFNYNEDSIVYTKPLDTFSEFYQQRKRWAGKWRYYNQLGTILTALFVALINVATLVLFYFFIISEQQLLLGSLIATKFILEGSLLFVVLKFFRKNMSPIHYLLLFTVYPFYVVLFGVAANFGRYSWKGRMH